MNWRSRTIHIYAFFYRNLLFARRNVFVFVEILFWPAVALISIGLMGEFLELEDFTRSFILTGAITSGVIQVTQLDVSYSLLYDIWSKSLKHTFLAPVREYEYLIGAWFVGMIRGSVVFVLLTVFARHAFGFRLPALFPVVVYLSGLFACAVIIGMSVCYLVLVFGQRVEVTAWSMAVLLMLLSGIYYPVSLLPQPFRLIAEFIPVTYFLEYIRSYHHFEPVLSHVLVKGFSLCVLYFFLMRLLIRRASEKARITGMILRLSE